MSKFYSGLLFVFLAVSAAPANAGGFYSATYGVRGRVYSNYMNNYAGERMAARGQAVRRGNRYYLVRSSAAIPYSRIRPSSR